MLGKYKRPTRPNKEWIHKVSDSSLWRHLAPLENVIRNKEFWVVGDGKSINMWSTKWFASGSKLTDLNVQISAQLLHLCVNDLVSVGCWKLTLISDLLSEETSAQILATPPSETAGADVCAWAGTRDGNYRVSACYNMVCDFDSGGTDSI